MGNMPDAFYYLMKSGKVTRQSLKSVFHTNAETYVDAYMVQSNNGWFVDDYRHRVIGG